MYSIVHFGLFVNTFPSLPVQLPICTKRLQKLYNRGFAMSDQLTPLAEYIEALRSSEENHRHERVGMATLSTEAELSSNMVWRIVRQGLIPKADKLRAIAKWAGGDDAREVERVYQELMARAGLGAPAPSMSDDERRVLELIAPLDDENLVRFIEMLERFTPKALTELMSGAEEGLGDNWPPILTVVLSPTERDLLKKFRALPPDERDVAVTRMRVSDAVPGDGIADLALLFDVMLSMSVSERSALVRQVLRESQGKDSKSHSSPEQGEADES